jgi:hypothetical protein
MFYMPPPVYTYSRFINVPSETNRTTRDTPYAYLGISYGDTDMEGGIGFHPAGRGITNGVKSGRIQKEKYPLRPTIVGNPI